uniref:Uncharacterized protein n=1 Tax=Emiliania huxleyi TaxID=2903 RepID=A0A7S3T1N2_EMIHU
MGGGGADGNGSGRAHSGGAQLYAVGGLNDDGWLSSVERYDPGWLRNTNAWEAVAPMGSARQNPGVAASGVTMAWRRSKASCTLWEARTTAALDGKLYAVGGQNYDDGWLSSVERYDPATNAGQAVAPMATARCNFAMAVVDGKLYAVGGSARSSGTTRR